jgi:DNA-binding MarR family transcriptional regulator
MGLDRRLFFVLHRAHRALFAHANVRLLDTLEITGSQLAALLFVAKHDGCSPSDIASLLDMNKSAAGALVQRLERSGLLRREPNPHDARGTRLHLTPKGQATRVDSLPVIRKLTAEVTEGFSPDEVDAVLRLLNSIVDRFGDADA